METTDTKREKRKIKLIGQMQLLTIVRGEKCLVIKLYRVYHVTSEKNSSGLSYSFTQNA